METTKIAYFHRRRNRRSRKECLDFSLKKDFLITYHRIYFKKNKKLVQNHWNITIFLKNKIQDFNIIFVWLENFIFSLLRVVFLAFKIHNPF